jgi:Glyoxalase-like domain
MSMHIDHLIVAAPSREEGIAHIEALTGVTPQIGGQHPQYGTCNALASLGEGVYLEIIAPDRSLPDPGRARLFGMDELATPRLMTWVARSTGIVRKQELFVASGIAIGKVTSGGRQNPDGSEVRWSVSDPYAFPADGVIPFLIDWDTPTHPSESAVTGLKLFSFRAEHPDAERVQGQLALMGCSLAVERAETPALIAKLDTPNGPIELR